MSDKKMAGKKMAGKKTADLIVISFAFGAFLLIGLGQIEFRDAELAFELPDFVQIDRADDVDDRELGRVGGDDGQSDDLIPLKPGVNLDVVPAAFVDHTDDLIPSRR